MVRFSGPLSGPPGDFVFAPTMRHRPTTRKSVPFSDTEIGVGFRDKRYRFWTQINATRRHRNRCRVTWSLVLNLNQIRCCFATPKSVSFCGALVQHLNQTRCRFTERVVQGHGFRYRFVRGASAVWKLYIPRCSAARYLHDEAFQKPTSIWYKRDFEPWFNLVVAAMNPASYFLEAKKRTS